MIFKFKYKSAIIFICILLISACKNKNTETSNNTNTYEEIKITSKDIDAIKYTDYALSNLSEKSTNDWLYFNELNNQIEILKKGDLVFFNDENEILTTFILDLKEQIPEDINTFSIQARLTALETAIFKLEGINNLKNLEKETVITYIKDVLVSYSNLILQINKKLEKDTQKIEK
ncbi:MAG: hypothetical protein HKO92_00065 [Flavobacteriaceae bacterium]|nr:hypothetical protein [Bacteroidia bacterium]NNK81499.1 hypothetical protein [Flavobacteriaceae bacterium]